MFARAILFVLFCWTCHLPGTSATKPTVNVQKYMRNLKTLPELIKSVSAGTKKAVETCKYIFRNDIWNCHVDADKIKPNFPVFFREVLPANKEGAFLQSLGAAGVMYTLTLNCRKGKYEDCACVPVDRPPKKNQNWRWFGCNENVKFGEALAMKFMDALEKERRRKALNLHNNKVGRKIVKMAARKLCRCHGPTGSCALKTCHRELVPFSKVGEMMKEKYENAIEVGFKDDRLVHGDEEQKKPLGKKNVDMVYYDPSPNYCMPHNETNYPGMAGRKCSTENQELSTCRRPCSACGMAIKKITKTKPEKCQCKFHWCCRVECKMCDKKFVETTCK